MPHVPPPKPDAVPAELNGTTPPNTPPGPPEFPTQPPTAPPGPRFEPPPSNPTSASLYPEQPPATPPGPRFEPPPATPSPAPLAYSRQPAPPPPPGGSNQQPFGHQPPPPTGPAQLVSPPTRSPGRVRTNTYDHQRSTWGLGDMFASLGVYFIGATLLILLILFGGGSDTDGLPEGPWLLVAVVGPHTMLLAHLFWVRHKKAISFAQDFQLRFRWSDIGIAVGLFFGAVVSAGIIAVAITEITGEQPTAAATDLAQDSGDGGLTIWLVLFAILGATFVPVVEELVYRGLFWSALEKRGMKPWPILFITSAVFAIIHLEPIRTAVLFAVGMAIGVGRLVTGRVGASIAVHVLINSVAMAATVAQIA